jgi:hypothetical protein
LFSAAVAAFVVLHVCMIDSICIPASLIIGPR